MKTIKVKKNTEVGPEIYDVILGELTLTGDLKGLPEGQYNLELVFDDHYQQVLWTITKGPGKGFKICPIVGYNPDKRLMVSSNPLVVDGKFNYQRSRDGLSQIRSFLYGQSKAKLEVIEPEAPKSEKPKTKKPAEKKAAPAKKTAKAPAKKKPKSNAKK